MREFDTGATRDTDSGKFDYEAFLHPAALESYAAYMHKNRVQADGNLRDGDNWQKGIPKDAYMKSMWRHFMSVWSRHRNPGSVQEASVEDELNALLFNVMGYLYEELVRQGRATRPAGAHPSVQRVVDAITATGMPKAFPLANVQPYAGAPPVAPASVVYSPGEKVRVAKRVDKENGWNNVWVADMNAALHATEPYAVEKVSPHGVFLRGAPSVHGYAFPPSALERVNG